MAFLDSDDAFFPEMTEFMVECMQNHNADIVTCSFYISYSDSKMKASEYDSIYSLTDGCISSNAALRLLMNDKISIGVWNKLYKKSLFKGLRFPEGYVYEDQIMTPFLLERAKKVAMLSQPLLLHRRNRPGSITATVSEQNVRDWLYAMKIKESFIMKHTPAVFDMQMSEHFEESLLRGIILQYTKLLSLSDISLKTKHIFENEIRNRGKNIRCYSLKTQAGYYLYRINPHLCYYTSQVYRAVLKSLRRLTHPHG